MKTIQPYNGTFSALQVAAFKAAFLGLFGLLTPATFLAAAAEVITPDQVLQRSAQDNWGRLYACYNGGYEPPRAIGNGYIGSEDFTTDCQGARVYATEGMDNGLLQRLLTEREPVNISFTGRSYNDQQLNENFGYSRSAYYSIWKERQEHDGGVKKSFSPTDLNIAVLTPTRLFKNPYKERPAYDEGNEKELLILSVIGAAFDHEDQPDTLHFLEKNGSGQHTITDEKREAFTLFMISKVHIHFE